MRFLLGLLVFAAVAVVMGLAGESDVRSQQEARYRAALAHIDAAREAGHE